MRVAIREAIYKAAHEKSGYAEIETRTGFACYINKGGFKLPCVWLCPLELKGKTGRRDGTKIYAGVAYMMESITDLTPEQKDEAWDRMEDAFLKMLDAATEATGILFENVHGDPDEYALSGFNTISTTIHFDVKTRYCADRE